MDRQRIDAAAIAAERQLGTEPEPGYRLPQPMVRL
jgi:hypothetical protein